MSRGGARAAVQGGVVHQTLSDLLTCLHRDDSARACLTSFTWMIPSAQLGKVMKGEKLESDHFMFEGIPGRFRVRIWPKGMQGATNGFCSAYVWASDGVALQMQLCVNRTSRLLDPNGPAVWTSRDDRGYVDFCKAPELSDVRIHVMVLQPSCKPPSAASRCECTSLPMGSMGPGPCGPGPTASMGVDRWGPMGLDPWAPWARS